MTSSRGARLAPLTGILGAALFVAGIVLSGDSPDSDASGAKVISFYVQHRSDQVTASILFLYGAFFLVFFAAALRSGLRRGERDEEGLATLSFGGAIMMATGILLLVGVSFAIADKPGKLEPAAAQALNTLSNGVWMPFIAGAAIFQLGAGIAIVKGRALPVWLGWVAIVLGVVTATPVGWFGFMVSLLWIVVVAILLAVRAPRGSAETAGDAAAA